MIKPAIVIVDDFPQFLHKLENDLEQKYSDRFRIIKADSGQQALDQLRQMSWMTYCRTGWSRTTRRSQH
jgi:thioredoxin reductase (NADPH)